MKSFILGLLVATATLASTALNAADDRNVTVINGTGYGIKFLGFNPPGDNDWSDNELSGTFSNGGSIYIKFNEADKGCAWNFKISWADPGYPDVLWTNVDLCKVDKLTLKYDRASDTTSVLGE